MTASCGDGFVQQGVEQCDDANMSNTDACVEGCIPASCGDGHVQQGVEQCDDANNDNTDTCVQGCQQASCGDGFVGPGEACDDGNNIDNDACSNMCAAASCGDGVMQQGEQCDDGNGFNGDACLNTCVAASCGDGWLRQGFEDCDDGNADNTDACLDSCELPSCGDGFVRAGAEECDDGNLSNTDACLNTCLLAECGDNYVQQGVEQCDDGNADNTDGCVVNCQLAVCGDGFLRQGLEQCDAGINNTDVGACTSACFNATCGDGLVWLGTEECDDGNQNPGDGCDTCFANVDLTLTRGLRHTCLMLNNGSVRCWGAGTYGQLGNGSNVNIGDGPGEMPPPPINVGADPVFLASGGYHNCVISATGVVRCWGYNQQGQLGIGSTTYIGNDPGEMPPAATNVGGAATTVVMGLGHSCALLQSGEVRCWGVGAWGKLGHGSTNSIGSQPGQMPPAPVDFGPGNVVQIVAGSEFTCVLLDNNKVRCWGLNNYGQLGYGNTENIGDQPGEMPPPDVNLGPGTIVEIAASVLSTCALFDNGDLRCWGYNGYGVLGIGSTAAIGDQPGEMPPASITNYGTGSIHEIIGGSAVLGVLMTNGRVRNWGIASYLGYGSGNHVGDQPGEMPPANVDFGGFASAISRGAAEPGHTCVMRQDRTVRCWGRNDYGQLGIGSTTLIGDGPGEMPPVATMAY